MSGKIAFSNAASRSSKDILSEISSDTSTIFADNSLVAAKKSFFDGFTVPVITCSEECTLLGLISIGLSGWNDV